MVKIICTCSKCHKELDKMLFDSPSDPNINSDYLSDYDHFGKHYYEVTICGKVYMVCDDCAKKIVDFIIGS